MMATQNVFMFIDETGIDEESKILAIACIITNEPGHLRKKLEKLKLDLPKEKRYKDIPSIKNLESKGFHYCEDHKDVRSTVIDLISELPFETYIYYKRKRHDFCASEGFGWYDQFFGKLMHDRLRKYSNSIVTICFEQHTNSLMDREQELRTITERLVHEIQLKDVCKFLPPPVVRSAGKEEPCLAVADYVVAVFKDYEDVRDRETNKCDNSGSWQARHFSMLRPKIRVIHNYGTGEFFTRQNPFL